MWDTYAATGSANWDTAETFEISKEGACPQCVPKQRSFCDMNDALCQSLQQFKSRLSGQDFSGCKAEWIEHKLFIKSSYKSEMAFLYFKIIKSN